MNFHSDQVYLKGATICSMYLEIKFPYGELLSSSCGGLQLSAAPQGPCKPKDDFSVRLDGQMDRQTDGRRNGQTNKPTDERRDRRTDG